VALVLMLSLATVMIVAGDIDAGCGIGSSASQRFEDRYRSGDSPSLSLAPRRPRRTPLPTRLMLFRRADRFGPVRGAGQRSL